MFKLTKKLERSPYFQIVGRQNINGSVHKLPGGMLSTGVIKKADAESFLQKFIENKKIGVDKFNTKAIDVNKQYLNSSDKPSKFRQVFFEKNALAFGNIRLSAIDTDWVENVLIPFRYPKDTEVGEIYFKYKGSLKDISNLEEKMNVSSKNNTILTSVIRPLSKLISFGAERKYCSQYRLKSLPLISDAEKPDYVYSSEEKDRCLKYNDHQITTLFIVLYYTGMRLQEALSLYWNKNNSKGLPQIDMDNKIINVFVSKTSIQRNIPMHPNLYEWLYKINDREQYDGRLFMWKNLQDKKNNKTPILGLGKRWEMMNKFADVKDFDQKKRHALRHTFASHCVNSGADEKALMSTVGWKNRVSAQKYIHPSLEVSRKLIFGL